MSNTIVRTEHGAFCAACQSLLSTEEEDFGVCDACDGEGIGCDEDDDDVDDHCAACHGTGRVHPLSNVRTPKFFCASYAECPDCGGTGSIY
jgi:DnaJ-class molecular chaperone